MCCGPLPRCRCVFRGVSTVAGGASRAIPGGNTGTAAKFTGEERMWDGDDQPLVLIPATSALSVGVRGADARLHTCGICLLTHALWHTPSWPCSSLCPSWQPVCGAGSAGHAEWEQGPWRVSLTCFRLDRESCLCRRVWQILFMGLGSCLLLMGKESGT